MLLINRELEYCFSLIQKCKHFTPYSRGETHLTGFDYLLEATSMPPLLLNMP